MSSIAPRKLKPPSRAHGRLATVILVVVAAGLLLAVPATASAHVNAKHKKAYKATIEGIGKMYMEQETAFDKAESRLNQIEAQMVNGLLQKTVFSHVPELLGASLQREARRFLGSPRLQTFNRTMANTVADYFGGDREEIFARMNSADFGFSALGQTPSPAAKPIDPSLRRLDLDAKPGAATAEAKVAGHGSQDGQGTDRLFALGTALPAPTLEHGAGFG